MILEQGIIKNKRSFKYPKIGELKSPYIYESQNHKNMAENKKSFILYSDQRGIFNKLSNEQAGELIKHIYSYVNDEDPEGNFITELAFESIKQQLKRDLIK